LDDDADDNSKDSEDGDDSRKCDEDLAPAQYVEVLIDCGPEMFQPSELAEAPVLPIRWALEAFAMLYRQVIQATVVNKVGKRNRIGALLFNTRPRRPPVNDERDEMHHSVDDDEFNDDHEETDPPLKTVHELVPLELPNADIVQNLIRMISEVDQGAVDLQRAFGYSSPEDAKAAEHYESHFHLPIFRGLEAAKEELTEQTGKKSTNKESQPQNSIWIFTTCEQASHFSFPQNWMERMRQRLKEFQQEDIRVYVWLLPTKATDENVASAFYKDLGVIQPTNCQDAPWDIANFVQTAMRIGFRPRPSFSVPLLLPDWKDHMYRIQIDGYKIVKPASNPNNFRCHEESGKKVKGVSIFETEKELIDVGEWRVGQGYRNHVSNDRLKLFSKLSTQIYVPLGADDTVKIKRSVNANPDFGSLILYGFKPRDQVTFVDSVDNYYFIYPQDNKVQGSSKAFAQLFYGMQRKGVVAVGELLQRVSATSRCVAFWPKVDDGSSHLPPQEGMIMMYLPFEDELRVMPERKDYAVRMSTLMDQTTSDGPDTVMGDGPDIVMSDDAAPSTRWVPEELVEAAVSLIEKQTLADRVLGVDFQNARLAETWKLLEHEALRLEWEPSNDYDTVINPEHERAIMDAAGEQVNQLFSILPEDEAKVTGKRKKTADPDADDTGIDWDQEYDTGMISKLTKNPLEKYCSAHGLKKSGNKQELVKRVIEDIANRREKKNPVIIKEE
jgi:hypothetical protein